MAKSKQKQRCKGQFKATEGIKGQIIQQRIAWVSTVKVRVNRELAYIRDGGQRAESHTTV